jgi:hypothetical protein
MEVLTTAKFHNQFELTPIAVPRVRACSGRISGTYTQGTQFILAPKMNMYVKKNATDPEANALPRDVSLLCERRAETSIIEILRPAEPQSIVLRRPILSKVREGMREPSGNISWMQPAMIWARRCSRPTFVCNTAGGG